jgi:carboxymethylenebutenolidase
MSASTGQMVDFPSNGGTAGGYLCVPPSGNGPGVLVIQEWWGLDAGIKTMAERLAAGGFVALAPDLYHGELAEHTEMDKAGQLMSSLPPERAARDMSAAIDHLLARPETSGSSVGVVGFCMGGMLTFLIAAGRGDVVAAAVPFYGFPQGDAEPDWSGLTAVVRGHMAEHDSFFGPDAAVALEAKLRALGKDVTLEVHAGTGHAFMGPHNALGTLDEKVAGEVWPRVLDFLHQQLG